jgi:hypothetical protein
MYCLGFNTHLKIDWNSHTPQSVSNKIYTSCDTSESIHLVFQLDDRQTEIIKTMGTLYISEMCLRLLSVFSHIGGKVVSVTATGPRLKSGQGYRLLMATKMRNTPFFRWEVKPDASGCKILQHVKEPCVA